jgi:hypothetical protein
MPSAPPASRSAAWFASVTLFATLAWLVSRLWVGLDFTDEMQYYGEITSLVRTGRYFQVDLFVQQSGYLFFLPLFKLHALAFPDQSYLVFFGRLVLLAGYVLVGGLFWRTATKLGGFSAPQKATALAAFLAWVPLQIFALSYNSTPYLLMVALMAVWLGRDPRREVRYTWTAAALLTMLTYTHPTAGGALTLLAVLEAGWRLGRAAGLRLVLATAVLGIMVGGIVLVLNGPGIFQDLLTAARFSRANGVGNAIRQPEQFAGLFVLLGIGGLFVRRQLHGPLRHPLGSETPPVFRWLALGAFTVAAAALLGLVAQWKTGYFAASAYLGIMIFIAASLNTAPNPPGHLPGFLPGVMNATLITGCAALLAMTVFHLDCGTGYFAATVFVVLLVLLAPGPRCPETPRWIDLAVVGTTIGAIFSLTSGNGLHNFGVGAAGATPFLVLFGARHVDATLARRLPAIAPALLPALVTLLLLHGVLHPYMEPPIWGEFKPMRGVPAFKGIHASATKTEAVARFSPLAGADVLAGKRLLVVGSQPWFYFATPAQPATPMFFMHYAGNDTADNLIGQRLFLQGEPDAILLTDTVMPPAIATQVIAWTKTAFITRQVNLPPEFVHRLQAQTGYFVSEHVFLLTRPPARP